MENNCSQDADIINKSDLEHIMADLSQDNQNFSVFLDHEEYVDINQMCDSTQEVKQELVNSNEGGLIICCPPNSNTHVRQSTGVSLCITDYPGPYNFDLTMAGNSYRKGTWVYSSKLKKVFIDVDKVMLVKFKVDPNCRLGLRVRALLVYPAPDHMNRAVSRCTLHKFHLDPTHQAHAQPDTCLCEDYNMVGHVLMTDHVEAAYEYNPESERHSVLVPLGLPQPGTETITVAYQFGCKNSCPGGMSRRAVNIVFTLETELGEVVGRRRLSVKVCSCPKRDKEREELEFDKGGVSSAENGLGKRRSSTANLREAGPTSARQMRFDNQYQQFEASIVNTDAHENISSQLMQLHQILDVMINQLNNLQRVLENLDINIQKNT